MKEKTTKEVPEKDRKVIKVTLRNTEQYLRILNGMFKLTDKEILVLAAFIDKQKELESTGLNVFSTEVKKKIAEELGMDDFNTMNVYVKRLKDKKAVIYKNSTYKVNPILIKRDWEKGVYFLWQTKTN